jgi:N-acetylneuraminic acid mutarotase
MKSRVFILTLAMAGIALLFAACGSNSSTTRTSPSNEWMWANGANLVDQSGSYGTQGVPALSNFPGSRQDAVRWVDKSGNLWLFGGYGYDSAGNVNLLNDLWKYSAGQWTWISGFNKAGQLGVYGALGVASLTNVPGARRGAVSWTDAAGNFWLFGGYGYSASAAGVGILNDLWEFNAGQWTWMGGSNANGQAGTYGTEGTGDPANIPGARSGAIAWTDTAGDFWLFGGNGVALPGDLGELNDLWKYSSGVWTWVSGSNVANQVGTYGTEGTAAPGNVPGARFGAVSWGDSSGSLWLFGGSGFDSTGANGNLNDLWEYSGGQWTWLSGSNLRDQPGTYGAQGTAAPGNVPGARNGAVSWTDPSGNLWLFGGSGWDSADTEGWLSDLWKYSAGQWIWVGGSDLVGQAGIYGTTGTSSATNIPGARALGVGWTDASGNLWLFGGIGVDSIGANGSLGDLWEYEP